MSRTIRIAGLVAAVVAAVSSVMCSGSPTLPSSTIATLSISGSPPGVGSTSQYSATVVMANSQDAVNVTSLATWQVDNTGIATVSKTGVVTGVAVGSTTLTVMYNGTAASEQLAIP